MKLFTNYTNFTSILLRVIMKKEVSLFFIFILLCLAFLLAKCKSPVSNNNVNRGTVDTVDIFAYNQRLGAGINMGNALEAPQEGDWGVTIQKEYFSIIKEAGFSNIRIPVRWSAHTAVDSPYTINSSFLNRVSWAVNMALSKELLPIINIHHFNELMENPGREKERFLSIWRQLSKHFEAYSLDLAFEILNEPHDNLTPQLWNQYLVEGLAVIRENNPERPVIIGTANWGGLSALSELTLPEDDNIIFTFHYYEPFHFTHQGAEWVDGSSDWMGTTWRDNSDQVQEIVADFNRVENWAAQNEVPVFVGEFGAYSKADETSRMLWTKRVRIEAERRDFSFAYWEFCSGFGAYNDNSGQWRDYLLAALIGN